MLDACLYTCTCTCTMYMHVYMYMYMYVVHLHVRVYRLYHNMNYIIYTVLINGTNLPEPIHYGTESWVTLIDLWVSVQ